MRDDMGLQAGWAVDDSGQTEFPYSVRATLPLMREAGAAWVRINLRLGACYQDWTTPGCDGRTALDAYDEVLAEAEAQGLQVLALLSNETWHGQQAAWSAGSAEAAGGDGSNDYLRAYVAAAATLAERLAGRVTAWELWNEPNAWTEAPARGGTFMYPSNWAWLLQHAGATLRGAGQLISGGLFAHDIGGSRTTAADYVRAAAAAGRPELWSLDGVGYHLYIEQGRPAGAATVAGYLSDVRRVCQAHGLPPALHVTEFAWRSDAVSEALQARNLEVAYETFRRAGAVVRGYWGATQDLPGGPAWGLLRADGSAKPAYDAYRRLASP
ncbi:MAG TPA: hypothetical protein PLJ35_06565 [Anaerolineae bacterium]|nr:hypothetical protein [Anaerolineae bacterium]HOQ98469.1 hypothetical protein [Anaerolineae bacterium]HPL29636.1 hypothetical protein [Anaerolineae bacterium]